MFDWCVVVDDNNFFRDEPMRIMDFKELIINLPEKQHSVTAKISIWDGRVYELQQTFEFIKQHYLKNNDTSKIEISRQDLYYLGKSNLDAYMLATIIWGYPSGMRGKNFLEIVNNWDAIRGILEKNKNGIINWEQNWNEITEIKGLGISTYTKLLNFLDIVIEDHKSLILDSRVIAALNSKRFEDLQINNLVYETAHKNYLFYLENIHLKAKELAVEPEKIEMFLFMYGQSLKIKSEE